MRGDEYPTLFGDGDKCTIKPLGKDWFFLGYNWDFDENGGRGWPIYLEDFTWECGWYWGGGYVEEPNRPGGAITDIRAHYHFDGFGFYPDCWDGTTHIPGARCNLYDGFRARISRTPLSEAEVWRLCDLMKQFYAYKAAAEAFQYGGHMISNGRTEAEIKPDMAAAINRHIEEVIIPEVRKLFDTSEQAAKE
jgi:hypothetical protein